MSYKNLLLFLLLFSTSFSTAQVKGDYVWLFGTKYGGIIAGSELNFNASEVEFEFTTKVISHYLTNASISDDKGNLLFYTNGCQVANGQHSLMENGNGINPGSVHEEQCNVIGRGYPVVQGAIALSMPNQDSVYTILHQKVKRVLNVPNNNFIIDGLYATTIDMTLENGLGAVVSKNEVVYKDTLDWGLLTSVKHSDGKSWWTLVSDRFSNRIYKILLSEDGFEISGFQDIDAAEILPQGSGGGQAVFFF